MSTFTDRTAVERKQAKLQRDWDRQTELDVEEAIKALLATDKGRTFLWWLLGETKVIGVSAFGPDDRQTNFTLGEQNIGIKLLTVITATDPGGYVAMQLEKYNVERERADHINAILERGNEYAGGGEGGGVQSSVNGGGDGEYE